MIGGDLVGEPCRRLTLFVIYEWQRKEEEYIRWRDIVGASLCVVRALCVPPCVCVRASTTFSVP